MISGSTDIDKASNKIKIAVCGCGHIGQRHIEMIHRHDELELSAMIDTEVKAALSKQYNSTFTR